MDTQRGQAGGRILRRTAIAALALLMLGAPAPALAAGALDQEQAQFGESKGLIGTDETGPDVQQGQVFTAGASGLLDQVDLPIRVVGSPGVPLTVQIRSLDGSGLPAAVLGSATVAEASVPACNTAACLEDAGSDFTTYSFVSVPLSTPATVASGTSYAIVLSATGAALDIRGDMIDRTMNRYEWAGVNNDFTYSGAGLAYNTFLGWFPSNSDRAFRTYVSSYSADVQAPINANGSSVFRAKGIVPVRFSLSLGGVATCALPPATIALTRTGGTEPGPVNEDTFSGAADSGGSFRIVACQYVYNINARALGAGTYLVEVKIGGQTVGSAAFELH